MTIPVMQFPAVQVPDEPSPLLTGLQTGLQVYSGLVNAFSVPQQMQAKQAQQQAQLGLTSAQTDLAQAQAQKALMAPGMGSDVGKTVDDYHKIANTYGQDSPEAKQALDLIKSKMDQQKAITASRNAYASGFGEMMAPKTVRDQNIADYINKGYSLNQSIQLAANQPPIAGQSEEAVPRGTEQDLTRGNQIESEITKTVTPGDIQKRQYAGARAVMTLDNLNQFIDQGALNYSGLAGKGQLAKDQLTASLTGQTPPQLSAYRNFQGQLNVLKDEYATALGVPADQISRGELASLFDVSQYSTNPDAAKLQLKNVKTLLDKSEEINMTSLHDLAAKNRSVASQYERKDSLQIKPEELKNASTTAQKQLGISQTQMPKFNSKAEFQAWYSQQSPEMKIAIKRQLGGQ
jgi:hypothetical protein